MNFDQIRIVLMATSHSGNVGAAARAMKNMGLSQLYLVSPRCEIDLEAYSRSSGAIEILQNATILPTLEDAIAECVLVVGTSARSRRITWPILNPRSCSEKVATASENGEVAIVFGREDRGLSNEELQRCNYHVHIPSVESFSSLNLAMAVQVLSYELRMTYLAHQESPEALRDLTGGSSADWDEEGATNQEVEGLLNHFESVMIETKFLDPTNPRQLKSKLRRLFQRVDLDKIEVNILRGFLTSVGKLLD